MTACMLAYTFYDTDNRVRRYAETLVKEGHKVDAIGLRREGQPVRCVIRGVNVHSIQKRVRDEKGSLSYLIKLLKFFLWSAWILTAQHLKKPYDVIHVHSVPDFEVFATIIPRLLGARVVLDIHDIVPEFYAAKFKVDERSIVFRLLLVIEKLSAVYANHVIIANHIWHSKLTQRSVESSKCTAIINYPDSSIFFPRERLRAIDSIFTMCYPGTLNSHQGVDIAIRAMALLREKVPQLRFVIIGDGPDREALKRLISQERLQDRVFIQGLVPMEQVAEILASVDLGVVPKLKNSFGDEAFSTKIFEFMAMGVPVIASDTRVDRYYFNENVVRFFESGNVPDLAAKILQVIQDPVSRDALRENATAFVKQNSWDQKKDEYLALISRLVARERLPCSSN